MTSNTADADLRVVDDKALIEMTLAGQDACFEELMQKHLGAVRKRVRSIIRNETEAEDVLQEVQLKVWEHLSSFRCDSSFRTWMTRIAINEALQSIRRAKTRHQLHATDLDRVAAPMDSPERCYARQEIAGTIHKAIRQLPSKFQQVLVLRELRERSTKETATELNASLALVKTRLFRARARLSKILQQPRKKPSRDWQAEIAA